MLTLLPDLNVAPLKYAHVHREHGGPVHALSFVERALPEGTFFEAFVHLETKCVGTAQGPHGTGFAAAKADAINGAISDAMALWAWHVAARTPELANTLRFDLNPTRLGFAAFPGLGVQGAHKRALFAAAERWTLRAWWAGLIPHVALEAPGVQAVQLRAGIAGVSTVITWEPFGIATNYGIGTAATPAIAHAAARLSMLRARDGSPGRYSSGAGASEFQAHVATTGPKIPATPPKPILEIAVAGLWQQYAHVWRCLFDESGFGESGFFGG